MNTGMKIFCRLNHKFINSLMPILPYRQPEILENMLDVIHILKKENIHSVLLVTDKGIRGLGLTVQLEQLLAERQIDCAVYDDTQANPTTANVDEAKVLYLNHGCEALISFGGGSSMDCAKGVGIRLVRPDTPMNKLEGLIKVGKDIPLLIAIPTTSGTGSEATLSAVITDAGTHHKYAITDFHLFPRYAVLMPELTLGLPKRMTAFTGMDALTHAVEAYINKIRMPDCLAAAEESVKLIFENLEKVYEDGSDLEARKNMMRASYLAGVALCKNFVGYIHAVSHPVTAHYGVPHGLANAVLLPVGLRAYGNSVTGYLAKLAKAVGLVAADMEEKQAAESFISHIEGMNRRMGIPTTIKEIRKEDIPEMAMHADKEANPIYPTPVLWDAKELEKLYYLVYEENADGK